MSNLLTKLDIKFHNRSRLMQDRMKKLKKGAEKGFHNAEDNFFDYIDDIEDTLETGRERVAAASDVLEDWVLEKQDKLEDWHHKRDEKKLMKEADKAQKYAEAAMDVAVAALDEAEWALAKALMTQSYASSVK